MGSAHAPGSQVIDVEVPGGALAVEVISSGTEPVLATHGISRQRRLWNWLRAAVLDFLGTADARALAALTVAARS